MPGEALRVTVDVPVDLHRAVRREPSFRDGFQLLMDWAEHVAGLGDWPQGVFQQLAGRLRGSPAIMESMTITGWHRTERRLIVATVRVAGRLPPPPVVSTEATP